jgi:hypothetical protein
LKLDIGYVTELVVTPVIRPFASTVKRGMTLVAPYVPADTPEFAKVNVMFALADPSKLVEPEPSPEMEILRAVFSLSVDPAEPVTEP